MSLHVLAAGAGYTYYTREIASGDELRAGDRELGDYYTVHGLPPGEWVGDGCAALGLRGEVTEAQMANLYGEGVHPERERVIAEKMDAGLSRKDAEKAAKLGRAYYQYQQKDTILGAVIREREAAFVRINHRPVTAAERHRMQATEGAILFRKAHGRNPSSKEELGRFITAELRPQQNAVAGFDMTMTPVKSVSVLWAVGGEEARKLVENAQQQALKETVQFLQKHAIATRTGANGIAQEDVPAGIIAGSFRHYDSRSGDPNIHNHLVIANKVQDAAGHWKTIDSKLLHKMNVPASEFYNGRIQGILEDAGLSFEARHADGSKQAIMEIKGIPSELLTMFSTRSEDMKPVLKELIDDYQGTHGKAPDPATLLKLAQRANLETRADKKHVESLHELTGQWRSRVTELMSESEMTELFSGILASTGHRSAAHVEIADAARAVIEAVSDKRASWSVQHVMAESQRWAKTHGAEHGSIDQDTVNAITEAALAVHSVRQTPLNPYSRFAPLERADGSNIFEHSTSVRYTSHAMIRNENLLIRAGHRDVIPAASADDFLLAIAHHNGAVEKGEAHNLSQGQLRLAYEFATSTKLLGIGIGAAGTGKSTVMALVKDAVTHAGGNVIALAPSAAAAAVLGKELGVKAATTDLFNLVGGPDGRKDLAVHPGTVVIVDEAGMAGTAKLAKLVSIVESGGGVVRLVGDDMQLGAVQAGGVLSLLVEEIGAVELDAVHRFEDPAEATASLALRTGGNGTTDPFAWYLENDRIQAGDSATIESLAYAQWQQASNNGQPAVIMASTNEQAQRLSERAQVYRTFMGEIDVDRPGVTLRDGTTAWAGDTIVTRRNDPDLFTHRGRGTVRNGDLWEVTKTHKDGSLSVLHQRTGGKIRLPREYVEQHVHLGYAYTTHRAQGMTKDAGITIANSSTTLNAAYVALTRGRKSNKLFLELNEGQNRDTVLASIVANHGIEESAHTGIRSEYERLNNLDTMAGQYRHVDQLATTQRMAVLAREVLGEAAEEFIAAESFGAVATNLAKAETAGWDAGDLLRSAYEMREFETAVDNSAVLSFRIESIVEAAPALVERFDTRRPLANLSTEQLNKLTETAEVGRRQARETAIEVKTLNGPWPKGHWKNRVFGTLSDEKLEQRLRANRLDAAAATAEPAAERKTQWEIRQLKKEITHRAQLSGPDLAQETRQRANLHGERVSEAGVIAAQVRAEQHYRAHTPARTPAQAILQAPDRLPEWIAPIRALQDPRLPTAWKEHLQERRQVLATRFDERGHILAATAPEWAQGLGPVPARVDLNQRWRDTAAEIAAFREMYKIPDTELTPVPARYREHELGAALNAQAVAISNASKTATPAPETEIRAAAAEATAAAADSHVRPAPAHHSSEADRIAHQLAPAEPSTPQQRKARPIDIDQHHLTDRERQALKQARAAGILPSSDKESTLPMTEREKRALAQAGRKPLTREQAATRKAEQAEKTRRAAQGQEPRQNDAGRER